MTSTVLTLALMGITPAFAADELPSTCGTNGDELCVDEDGDGVFANAKDDKAKDCQDDLTANQFAKIIYPGAPVALGDGADTNCDGTDDDAEKEEALAAAAKQADPKDPASPKAEAASEALGDLIDECLNGGDYASEAGEFIWSREGGRYGCHNLPQGWGYSRSTGVRTRADNAALGAAHSAQKGVAELQAELGHPGTPEIPATKNTPKVEAVAPTGLYLELAELEAAMAKADGETRAELAAAKKALEEKIAALETRIGTLETRVSGLNTRVTAVENDIDDLQGTGGYFEAGIGGGFMAGRSMYEFEGGPVVRGPIGGGGSVVLGWGYVWGNGEIGADVGVGQGARASGDESLPYTFGHVAVAPRWYVGSGYTAIGPEAVILWGTMGNPLDATVSGWGPALGVSARHLFPLSNHLYISWSGALDVGLESFGTRVDDVSNVSEDIWDKGPQFGARTALTLYAF